MNWLFAPLELRCNCHGAPLWACPSARAERVQLHRISERARGAPPVVPAWDPRDELHDGMHK